MVWVGEGGGLGVQLCTRPSMHGLRMQGCCLLPPIHSLSHRPSDMPDPHPSTLAATGLAGIVTGALAFVSAVDTRTLLKLADSGQERVLQQLFPIWWPNGRDLMLPLLLVTAAAHGWAFGATRDQAWLGTGGLVLAIAPYTKFVLGEDIAKLRAATSQDVQQITHSFCFWHHPRLLMALGAFGCSLLTLAKR